MDHKSALGAISRLSAPSLGVFRGSAAVDLGVSRKQVWALRDADVIERVLPDTFRMTVASPSSQQRLRAALLWAGDSAAAAGRSGANVLGVRVTGVEATLVALGAVLDGEALEIACEDARRRQLTSVAALRVYIARFARPGRAGVRPLRALLDELDPVNASRSALEVKTRRLLVANGLTGFVRELPLEWNGRTYYFDFSFERGRTILETNGRRWHDDPSDYEKDNVKWSVPAFHGYRVVFATWDKVTRHPGELLAELAASLGAHS